MVSVTPRSLFTAGKDPVPIVQETGWAPGPVWTDAENLASTRIRSPDRPARSSVAIPTELPGPLAKQALVLTARQEFKLKINLALKKTVFLIFLFHKPIILLEEKQQIRSTSPISKFHIHLLRHRQQMRRRAVP